jgi:hypothetical protein
MNRDDAVFQIVDQDRVRDWLLVNSTSDRIGSMRPARRWAGVVQRQRRAGGEMFSTLVRKSEH